MDLASLQNVITEIQYVMGKVKGVKRLDSVIGDIKTAFETYWQDEHVPLAKMLLEKIRDGVPTPVLTICGRGTQEIRYTRYLAYYLDPGKNHGLGSGLLKTIMASYDEDLRENWAEECQVIPELWIGNYINKKGKTYSCFCDIGIIGSDFAIIIEQKILSGEDSGSRVGLSQLKRYSAAIDENPEYNNRIVLKIFITPTGRLPSGALEWVSLSYNQIIESAYTLLESGKLTPVARENLCRLLMDLAIGPYEKSDKLITAIQQASEEITNGMFNLQSIISFRRLVEENRMIINIITEGMSWKSCLRRGDYISKSFISYKKHKAIYLVF